MTIRKRHKTTCAECGGKLKLIGATLVFWSASLDEEGHVIERSKVTTQKFNQADREYLMCMSCMRQYDIEKGGWDVVSLDGELSAKKG